MKQTLLPFGQCTPKTAGRIPECSGKHPSLRSIQNCKKCYTIAALRNRCASTTNVMTGQPVGIWGTKDQMLERLIKNARVQERSKISAGIFAYSISLQCCCCII